MSHKKLRSENNCLNCGHTVENRFCSQCGQENLQLQDSAIHLVIHYFQDLLHYDGKFWNTFKHFITKPGMVAEDYMAGKRQQHLKPIQFYVFASTVFFLFLFFIADPADQTKEVSANDFNMRLYHLKQEREFLAGTADTVYVDSLMKGLAIPLSDTVGTILDSTINNDFEVNLFDSETDGTWLENFLSKRVKEKTDEMKRVHQGDEKRAIISFFKELLHSLPQLFFLSLPFFAFFLLILYFRSTRNTYVGNFIFSIYHYAYLYIIFLVYLMSTWIVNKIDAEPINTLWIVITSACVLYPFIYLYLSLRRFYKDNGLSLLLRYLVLLFLFLCTLIILFLAMTILTFLL